MIADYDSGDFYLGLAKRMGALSQNAKREDSPEVESCRELYKQLALAIQYGMGSKSLSQRLGQSENDAKKMLKSLRLAYPKFWAWRERVRNAVAMDRPLPAALGWQLLPPYSSKSSMEQGKSSTLSALNFPVQATGSEILRATVIRLAEEGFEICATLHDSVMVELDFDGWQDRLRHLEFIMAESTRPLLEGHAVAVDSKVLMPGERYLDQKGNSTWQFMSGKLGLET
jgi:DNA polymerase I-like protein with 3'-5' exonuclease and polymerase domains